MSDDTEDLVVKARLRAEIEGASDALRRRQQVVGPVRDIVKVLVSEISCTFSPLHGWKLVERPDDEMPDEEGYADFTTKELVFRRSVLVGAKSGHNRCRMTVAHEMGHVVLEHQHGRLRRMQEGNKEFKFGRKQESAEWQARYFAAVLLMPRDLVKECSTATELSSKCEVSLQAAEIRFDEVNVRGAAKQTPPDIKAGIDKLKALTRAEQMRPQQQTVLNAEQRMKLAWAIAPEYDGHDPREYRLVNGLYVIRYSRFGIDAAGGWRLRGDAIVPWDFDQGRV
jgi:Zn-dependent peptidase ImmA (M78 family)